MKLHLLEGSYSNQRINLFEHENRNMPHWRSSRPTMMSERQVREIMHQYNGSIDSFTKEILELKQRCKELDNEILENKQDTLLIAEERDKLQKKVQLVSIPIEYMFKFVV